MLQQEEGTFHKKKGLIYLEEYIWNEVNSTYTFACDDGEDGSDDGYRLF